MFRVFLWLVVSLFIALAWDFFGNCLGMNRGSFSLGLALKTPLGRNKVVRLGLFWILFWIQELEFHLHQSNYAKYLFLFSFFIARLFIFLLLKIVDLVYV